MKNEQFKNRLVHLYECRGIGLKTLSKMVKFDPSLNEIYFMTKQELQYYFQISSNFIDVMYFDLHHREPYEVYKNYQQMNIQIITIFDHEYPKLLKHIYNPPLVLYCKGNIQLLQNQSLAVVGTRNPSTYGIQATKKFVSELVEANYSIVSGLARGIDYIAHKTCMEQNGQTIAILGSGFSQIYPREHKNIAKKMAESHLLLSEYPPNTKPQKRYFPERNRIISGVSIGTLVIEAREKSGSLITADLALNEGREVFAVPGSIFSEPSKGTNNLIQQGAKLIQSVSDILSELPKNTTQKV
jgi:DNA processing protein